MVGEGAKHCQKEMGGEMSKPQANHEDLKGKLKRILERDSGGGTEWEEGCWVSTKRQIGLGLSNWREAGRAGKRDLKLFWLCHPERKSGRWMATGRILS